MGDITRRWRAEAVARSVAPATCLLALACTLSLAPASQADTFQAAPSQTATAASHPGLAFDWDALTEGEVLAVGTPATNAHGEMGCSFPRISIEARLDAGGAVGTGKALTTSVGPGCTMVVSSKALMSGASPG